MIKGIQDCLLQENFKDYVQDITETLCDKFPGHQEYIQDDLMVDLQKKTFNTFMRVTSEYIHHEQLAYKIVEWQDALGDIPIRVQKEYKLSKKIKKVLDKKILPKTGTLFAHYQAIKRDWEEIKSTLNEQPSKKRSKKTGDL